MQQKIFLKLDGVRGESENPRHYGEIEIIAFSWGGKHQHAAGGSGKASIKDLSITKKADQTSAFLMVACHRGQHFGSKLEIRLDLKPKKPTIGRNSEAGFLKREKINDSAFI